MHIVYCIVQGFRKGAHLHKHLDEHFVRIRIRVCSQELGAELLCYLLDLFHVCMHKHTHTYTHTQHTHVSDGEESQTPPPNKPNVIATEMK